jgi:heme/copper-type cytochrome/quinol oxidase subunit 2
MRLARTPRTLLLAVLAVAAVVLTACAPSEEPAAEAPTPEPADDLGEEAGAEQPDAGQTDVTEVDAEEPDGESNGVDATEDAGPDVEDLEVTAYVVAYHWGFALFDEDGRELDQLRVPVGASVELVAVNDHAGEAIAQLPEPVAQAIDAVDWHGRAHHDVEMGRIPDPEAEAGASLGEVLSAAHDGHGHMGPVQDHGLMVTGVGARTFLDAHGREPERLVFTVDEEGAFEFRCTEECGFGHDYQRWELLVVEA